MLVTEVVIERMASGPAPSPAPSPAPPALSPHPKFNLALVSIKPLVPRFAVAPSVHLIHRLCFE